MATYQKRGETWRAMIRLKGFPAITRTFDNRADAVEWGERRERDMRAGKWTPPTPTAATHGMDLNAVARKYHADSKHHVRPVTLHNIDFFIRSLPKLAPWLAQKAISDITPQDIARYRDDRLKTVCPSSVNQELKRLSAIFAYAIKERGLIEKNPVQSIRKPPGTPSRDRRLLPDEEARLITSARKLGKAWLADMILFALETGMRRGEIVKMRYEHILWERSALIIPLENDKIAKGRTIPLSAPALAILRENTRDGDPVVWRTQDQQKPITGALIDIFFRRAKHALGIENLHFHDLRHEALSRFSERGLNPLQTAAISGHQSMQMLKRYTHLQPEDLADLIAQPRKTRMQSAEATQLAEIAEAPDDTKLRQVAARIAERKKMEAIAAEYGITVEELVAEMAHQ